MRVAVAVALSLFLVVVPVAASAAQAVSLDGYFVHEADKPEGYANGDGDGFGVRVLMPFESTGVRVHTEFQSVEIHDKELEEFRVGAGWMMEGRARFGVEGEYVSFTAEYSPSRNGYGIHGLAEYSASEQIMLYGKIGYINISGSISDADGPEYSIGAVFQLNTRWGVFAEYRYTDTRFDPDDGGAKFDDSLENIHAGLRIKFGI